MDLLNWIFDKVPSAFAVPGAAAGLLCGLVYWAYVVATARGNSLVPVIILAVGCLIVIGGGAWFLVQNPIEDRAISSDNGGGKGGNAKVSGNRSGAEGGAGGIGGLGVGGDGGNAEVEGDDSFARGGDGGNAGTVDGRGGRRTLSPGERLNLPTNMWPYGYGGAGANAPEYDRRLFILTQLRNEYLVAFPDDARFIHAGIDTVPEHWINKRLEELGERWRIELWRGGYVMPALP